MEGTTWSPRNGSMKGIFKELFSILSFFKSQICVHILPCVYHIFIVMINQMANSFGDMFFFLGRLNFSRGNCPIYLLNQSLLASCNYMFFSRRRDFMNIVI